jgi:hypothetical protein
MVVHGLTLNGLKILCIVYILLNVAHLMKYASLWKILMVLRLGNLSLYIYAYISSLHLNSKATYERKFDAWEFKKRETNFVNNPVLLKDIEELWHCHGFSQ